MSQVPRQAASPAPVTEAPAPSRPPASWRITPSLLAHEYLIEHSADLESVTDSGTTHDSLAVTAAVSVRLTDTRGFAGLIRRVTLVAPGDSALVLPGVSFPLAFSAAPPESGAIVLPAARPAPAGSACRSPAEIPLSLLRDFLVQLPDSFVLGTSWSDSGSYRTCRDGVELSVSTRRSFRLRGFRNSADGGELVIDRSSETTMRGVAVRGDDSTTVEGHGTSLVELSFSARSGVLLRSAGTGTLDLFVRSRVRAERARQVLRSRVSLVSP